MLKSAAIAERRFYAGMVVAILLVIFLGFAQSFYLRPLFPHQPHTDVIYFIHGTVFSLWILLYVAQTSLIAANNRALHRKAGMWGTVLAISMLALGIYVSFLAAATQAFGDIKVSSLSYMAIPLSEILIFGICVAMGVKHRRDLQGHKRWLLLSTVALLPAALDGVPGLELLGLIGYFVLTDLFIVALAIWDMYSKQQIHRVTVQGGLLVILLSQVIPLMVYETSWWLSFAKWATGLVR